MSMGEKLSIEAVKEVARKKGMKPGRVKGIKNSVQLTKGRNPRIEVISWEEFETQLNAKRLAVFSWKGWLKIMKR